MNPLTTVRRSKGLTLEQVAKNLDMHTTVLYEIEKGKKSTISERATNIATFYGIAVEDLFVPTYYRAKGT
ncbi:hypothetical protein BK716_31330 [Bacillus thuringiensis serovar higo]|uniref:HTH cro/C1-type domain-containing protein n=2 Tax=Bacillus thuringiensis TaxID=1428 RepID=A0A9X6L8R4_BACUH|nr:hypothetical protein BK716_31330 [Bacillus thuringiensis serovar higo]